MYFVWAILWHHDVSHLFSRLGVSSSWSSNSLICSIIDQFLFLLPYLEFVSVCLIFWAGCTSIEPSFKLSFCSLRTDHWTWGQIQFIDPSAVHFSLIFMPLWLSAVIIALFAFPSRQYFTGWPWDVILYAEWTSHENHYINTNSCYAWQINFSQGLICINIK